MSEQICFWKQTQPLVVQGCSYLLGKTPKCISQVYTAGFKDLCVVLCDADSWACIWLQVQYSSSPLHSVFPWEEIQVCRQWGCCCLLSTDPGLTDHRTKIPGVYCFPVVFLFCTKHKQNRTKMIPNQRGTQTKMTERELNGRPWWELNADSTLTNGTCLMSQRPTNFFYPELQYNSVKLPLTLLLDECNSIAMRNSQWRAICLVALTTNDFIHCLLLC